MLRMKKVVVLSTVLGLLGTSSVFASEGVVDKVDTNSVQVEVMSGKYDLQTSVAEPFENVEIRRETQSYHTGFSDKFSIEDLRGLDEGWSLSVMADPLKSLDNGEHVFNNVLSIKPIETITRTDDSDKDVDKMPVRAFTGRKVLGNEAVTMLESNGYGAGTFDLEFADDALMLTVGPKFKAGSYATTLNWTLQTNPSEVQK